MKQKNILRFGITLFLILIWTCPVGAVINFQASTLDKIELELLEISNKEFLKFVHETIMDKPAGLGKYGRVSFYPCDLEVKGLKLIDYKTSKGKEVRFLSNPSCHQTLLSRVLQISYDYQKSSRSSYENRKCILAVEKIISPLLEYYTLKIELSPDTGCDSCEVKEKDRLNQVLATQKQIVKACQPESQKVMRFISDLDSQIEKSYTIKASRR